jgi:peptidoglycan/LPS O-acetylase OafA/YrhL
MNSRTSLFLNFPCPVNRTTVKRLLWLDVAKGLAILVVVYFHFFRTYFEHGALPPADWSGLATGLTTFLRLAWLKLSGLGFHAVGVFIILSGWALMQSTARRAAQGAVAWGEWYRARLLRLYPMYWVAHLVYLVSPFTARFEKIDGRFLLSLLGLRIMDISNNFYYLNAAWWYFTMLIQFYLFFPFLFWAARRLGPGKFLLGACALGFFVRYLLLVVYPQNGMWVQGGFAICRLPEFAFGMALGMWASRSPARVERFLLGGFGLLTGVLLYPAALQLYRNGFTYTFVDFGTGACCFLVLVGLAGFIARFSYPARAIGLVGTFSYGIYLVHHPYVIWLGLRIREQPIWIFLLIAAAALTVLSAWGMILEKGTNALVSHLLRTKAKSIR